MSTLAGKIVSKTRVSRIGSLLLAVALMPIADAAYASFDGTTVNIDANICFEVTPTPTTCKSATKAGVVVGPGSEVTGTDWIGCCVGAYRMDISGDTVTLVSDVEFGNFRYTDFTIEFQPGFTISDFCLVGYYDDFFRPYYPWNDTNFFPTITLTDSYVNVVWSTGVWEEQFAFGDSGGTAVFSTDCGSPPIADAGDDAVLLSLGSVVFDGTESFDPDGEAITFAWTLSAPLGSGATLDDSSSATPSFVADVYGSYTGTLVVTDSGGLSSVPDDVTVGFSNLAPVADAGSDQAAVIGDTVVLDGSGSSDANMDLLNFHWSFASTPAGSVATLYDASTISPSFLPDVPGDYIVSLVVDDGMLSSAADTVNVAAISGVDAAAQALLDLVAAINALSPDDFGNRNQQRVLVSKVLVVLDLVVEGNYTEALEKLTNDVLGKTDGCAIVGSPNGNDWIGNCAAQSTIFPLVVDAIDWIVRLTPP